jgi:hypothetical protein
MSRACRSRTESALLDGSDPSLFRRHSHPEIAHTREDGAASAIWDRNARREDSPSRSITRAASESITARRGPSIYFA